MIGTDIAVVPQASREALQSTTISLNALFCSNAGISVNLSKVAESSPLMDTLINILQGVEIDTSIDIVKSMKMNNNNYVIADKANSDKKGSNQKHF